MSNDLRPRLQAVGDDVVGPGNPVHRSIDWLAWLFGREAQPNVNSERARSAATGLGTHLLHLLRGFGMLNLNGYHSAAVRLLRPLEDALDCFAAVVLVEGAAEAWSEGRLRASDAARVWTPLIDDLIAPGMSLGEYRRRLRDKFNDLAHCPPEVCAWNLYFNPERRDPRTGAVSGSIKVNIHPQVIAKNAHALDAHLVAHLLELLHIVRHGYSSRLTAHRRERDLLADLISAVTVIAERHNEHQCQEVRPPAELRDLGR